MSVIIYHNPRCSKSRQTLGILREHDIEPEIIEYLKEPPDEEKLAEIIRLLGVEPREIIRTGEQEYRDNQLEDPTLSEADLLQAMITHPILIERPIVLANGKAVIGRPPQRVLEIM